jgi:hypothetical protein
MCSGPQGCWIEASFHWIGAGRSGVDVVLTSETVSDYREQRSEVSAGRSA